MEEIDSITYEIPIKLLVDMRAMMAAYSFFIYFKNNTDKQGEVIK